MSEKICKWCGAEMRLEDFDIYPEGDSDHYWICDNCKVSCTERVSGGNPVRENWTVFNSVPATPVNESETSVKRVSVTLVLEPEVAGFVDLIREPKEISREDTVGCLLYTCLFRYLLACKLESLGLPDDTEIPGINALDPITPVGLELACKYLDLLVNPREVLPDGK